MPIATPEVYAQMLDRAKADGFAYPAINVTSSETVNAAIKGFADAGSDGIIQVSTGGAEFASGTGVKEMVTGAVAPRRVRPRGRREVPGEHRAAHRPLPEEQAGRLRPATDRAVEGAGRRRGPAALPVPHVGRLRGRAGGKPADRRRAAGALRGREDRAGDRDRGGRRRGGRRRRRDERQALQHARRRAAHRRGARDRREGALPAGRHVRQRARCLQAGQRQAPPGDPQGDPGQRRVEGRPGQAVRPGLPRRVRVRAERDPGGGLVRRGEDERGHRHPVRVHPADRRPHVHQLRRRAQGGRRGRKQEGVRPAQLPQGRRDGHGRAGRRGLRGAPVGREVRWPASSPHATVHFGGCRRRRQTGRRHPPTDSGA